MMARPGAKARPQSPPRAVTGKTKPKDQNPMRVTVPDATLDAYQAHADRQGRSLDLTVAAQLHRFRELPPGQPAIIVGGDLLQRLETHLGGAIADGADLTAKVERLAGITVHGIHLDFSPSQLEELQYRAERQGRPFEVLCQEIIRQMQDQWFWGSGAGEAMSVVPAAPAAPTAQRKAG